LVAGVASPGYHAAMSQALRSPLLTVDDFQDWEPPPGIQRWRWELVDGEPVAMSPPGLNRGAIQSMAAFLLTAHLRAHRPTCRVITTPAGRFLRHHRSCLRPARVTPSGAKALAR
jgi:Uma2 family endonuclease